MQPLNPILKKTTNKVPKCNPGQTTEEVRKYLLKNLHKIDTINYIYGINAENKLKGIVSIKELFSAPPDSKIRDIMTKKIIKAHPDTDQEDVVHMAIQHQLKSIPIVNKRNKFLGVIPSDEILYILDSESKEDLMFLSGIIPHDKIIRQDNVPIFKSFIHRTPWIISGLFGGILAAGIIGHFEGILEKEVILAAFIPLVVYLSNAVGTQSQTMYIRDLAVSENIPVLRYGFKQVLISALIGAACWLLIWLLALIFWQSDLLGTIVGFSIFCSIIIAVIFAIGIPYLLTKLNKDPAIGSGPFTTIIQDIISVVTYFVVASIMLT